MNISLSDLDITAVAEYDLKNSHRRILVPFEFEKYLRGDEIQWILYNLRPMSYWVAAIYLLFIYFGRKFMKNRKPFDLKRPLIIWNMILGIFSIFGFARTAPTLLHLILNEEDGFYKCLCTRTFGFEPEAFWGFMFIISKFFELADTVFIVLRKSPLIFLHWYHHVSVLLLVFQTGPYVDPYTRIPVVLNYAVHALMYSYYALKMANIFRIPKTVSKVITTLQMVQFVLSTYSMFMTVYTKKLGDRDCILHSQTVTAMIVMYTSYLILFVNYFIQTYIFRSKAGAAKKSD